MYFLRRKILAAAILCFCLGGGSWLGVMGAFERAEEVSGEAVPENWQTQPVLVIDAGHGGPDGGAKAADGTEEKDINLSIAMKVKEAAEGYPVKVVLTRETEAGLGEDRNGWKKRADLLERKRIIGEANPVLAVSIHLNSFPQDASVYGAQVFYAPNSPEAVLKEGSEQEERAYGRVRAGSRDFAEKVQEALEIQVPGEKERTVLSKSDILLMKDPVCPFILVECGFLSNQQEAQRLKSAEYQGLLASAIWDGINEILCLKKESAVPVTDSANRQGNIG